MLTRGFEKVLSAVVVTCAAFACTDGATHTDDRTDDLSDVIAEVEAAVWAFHAADTAMDAERVIDLLWPEYTMLADGAWVEYEDIVEGSREFMSSLEMFHTEWTNLKTTPLGRDAAVSSFQFRDSILTKNGELIQFQGPTTFVWQRRAGRWKLIRGDSDHYAIAR